MTPEEALEYKKKGGKLNEPIPDRDIFLFDSASYFKERGTILIVTHIPATNPMHEHGISNKDYERALEKARTGRIVRKIL